MDFRPIDPIQPLFRGDTAGGVGTAGDSREQGSLFADIFQAAVENVKETEQVKNDAEYRLATGQMDTLRRCPLPAASGQCLSIC